MTCLYYLCIILFYMWDFFMAKFDNGRVSFNNIKYQCIIFIQFYATESDITVVVFWLIIQIMYSPVKRGSPSWELELRPLGFATGNAFSVTRVWRYICKNTIRWPVTAHDVTTGATIIKGPPGEYIINFSGLFEETCILVGIQFSFIYHGEH